MKDYLEVNLNGTSYSVSIIPAGEFKGKYCWDNDLGEEGKALPTMVEASQDAIDWEAGRRDRYEGSDEADIDARNRYLNQRCDDARGA